MYRRGDDMGRVIAGQLNNVFTQVRLGHIDSGCNQPVVQADFFGYHRLSLNHPLNAMLGGHFKALVDGLLSIFGKKNMPAVFAHLVCKYF